MSGTAGSAPPTAVLGLDMDTGESHQWQQRAALKSRALVQTYLLTSSVLPPPTAGRSRGPKTPLRLPSLVAKGPRRRCGMARLSLSEPSLFTPQENTIFEGFSGSRRPSVLQKRPPPPPPPFCKTSQPHQHQHHRYQVQSCSRAAYIHFSQGIQPSSKPVAVRRHSHNPALSSETVQGDLRPLEASQAEPLSVIGKPCLLSSSQRSAMAAAAADPGRTQLHVFLPTEAEGQELDSESVDEGFMDELDSKITSLRLQQGAPKTV